MRNNGVLRIAVFGGSFDPPHYGHYDIVKNLEGIYDKVIVVPAYISPFKDCASDAKVRLSLCKKVFASQKTEVCSWEIKRGGVSYSVDTAAYLAKKYKGAAIDWVIGSEEVKKLPEWHNADKLKTLVGFLYVPRPGYDVNRKTLSALKRKGINIRKAPFCGMDISSTEVKIDIAFGKPNKYLPDAVRKAVQKGEFDIYGEYVDALYKYGLSQKRIDHTYGVAKRCAELAKLYGVNTNSAVIAGLLHDIAKSVEPDSYSEYVDTAGYPEPTAHAPVGAFIAKRDFGVSDEIAHSIRAHSTADAEMSPLDEVVYLADKTETGRNYKEVYYFRYLCGIDKDLAMLCALRAVSEYKDTRPCEMSQAAIAMYEERTKGKTMPEMPPASRNLPVISTKRSLGEVKSKALRAPEPHDGSVGFARKRSGEIKAAEAPSKSVRAAIDYEISVKPKTKDPSELLAYAVANELDTRKANNIDIIDLSGKTIIADRFVIASASSSTAVRALMGYVEDRLKKEFGLDPSKRDTDSEWIALDYGSVIIHIFTDRMRAFYNIERLWSDGTNITRYTTE